MRVDVATGAGDQRVRELASGIDALYLSGRGLLGDELEQRLAAARAEAEASGRAQPVVLGGVEFEVASHGMGLYRYCLSHRHGQMGISPSLKLPPFRVQPRVAGRLVDNALATLSDDASAGLVAHDFP